MDKGFLWYHQELLTQILHLYFAYICVFKLHHGYNFCDFFGSKFSWLRAHRFYGYDVRAFEILSGQVELPSQCTELYSTLSHHEDMFEKVLEAKGRQAIAHGARMTGVSTD